MKRVVLFAVVVQILLATGVYALPTLDNVTIDPINPWLDEDVRVTLNCMDPANNTIDNVTGQIEGPEIQTFPLDFTPNGDEHVLYIDSTSFLQSTGSYNINIICTNNLSERASTLEPFMVSELTNRIESINPSPAFTNDPVKIKLFVFKDDTPLNLADPIGFKVYLNNNFVTLDLLTDITYSPSQKFFTLSITAPPSVGVYSLDVVAEFDGIETRNETQLEVKTPIEFSFMGIDNDLVRYGDKITLSLSATDKGNKIFINNGHIDVNINSNDVAFDEADIYDRGDYYDVEITAPSLSPGKYDLDVKFRYSNDLNDFSIVKREEIVYGVVVKGQVLDANKGESFEMIFKKDGVEKKIVVNNQGEYSGFLAPGVYDIEFIHPKSKLFLDNVTIDEFDDPVKYTYSLVPDMPGISAAGTFIYGVALGFPSMKLEMQYDDKKVNDETELSVYRCDNWNSGRGECVADWEEISTVIDTVRNLAIIEDEYLSTFVIGTQDQMIINAPESLTINAGDLVELSGIVTNSKKSALNGVDLELLSNDVVLDSTTIEDKGVFTFSFLAPEEEGTHIYKLKATKDPYVTVEEEITIEVTKKKSLTVLVPETVRISLGETATTDVNVVNTGQKDFSELSVSLSGVPDGYHTLSTTIIPQLLVQEEHKVIITFDIPRDAKLATYNLVLSVTGADVSKEHVFALSIINKTFAGVQEDTTPPAPIFNPFRIELPTANIILPTVGNTGYIIIFALIALVVAYVFRQRRENYDEREEVKHLFNNLKIEVNRENTVTHKTQRKNNKPNRRKKNAKNNKRRIR